MVRVDADFSATPFKAKISNAEQLRVHPAGAGLVIGGRDMEAGQVSVRLHRRISNRVPQGALPRRIAAVPRKNARATNLNVGDSKRKTETEKPSHPLD
jgi:hypothetical protein